MPDRIEELKSQLARLRADGLAERDRLRATVSGHETECAALRSELERLREALADALRFACFLMEQHPFDGTDHVTLPGHGWRKLCGMLESAAPAPQPKCDKCDTYQQTPADCDLCNGKPSAPQERAATRAECVAGHKCNPLWTECPTCKVERDAGRLAPQEVRRAEAQGAGQLAAPEPRPDTSCPPPQAEERKSLAADPKCEACEGTGWYGDNGPGIKGNREYQRCDQCGQGKPAPQPSAPDGEKGEAT